MAVSWHCPHCNTNWHSSWPRREQKTVKCDNPDCGADIDNPYYEIKLTRDEAAVLYFVLTNADQPNHLIVSINDYFNGLDKLKKLAEVI